MEADSSTATPEELSEVFNALSWDGLWLRLVTRALVTMKVRHGMREAVKDLRGPAEELVADCLDRVFVTHSRKWNKDSYEDIELFLLDTMDSLVSNWLKTRSSSRAKHTSDDLILDELTDGKVTTSADIEQYHRRREEILAALEQMGAKEDELMIFFARVDDGLTKPAAIRKSLGMTESEYHNAFRRLHKKLKEIRAKVIA